MSSALAKKPRQLTEQQADFMSQFGQYTEPFDVATSQYSCSKATGFWNGFVGHASVATLRGLEARGLIELKLFWRGATVTIKSADESVS